MPKKIKDFKLHSLKAFEICENCKGEQNDALNTISIKMTNNQKHYKESNRPIISNYKMRLRSKCYNEISTKLLNFIMPA